MTPTRRDAVPLRGKRAAASAGEGRRGGTAGQRFVFVMLTPRAEVVRAREQERGTSLWTEWEWLGEEIERRTRRIGLWLDTSDQTPDETVATILARGWSEGLVEAPAPATPQTGTATAPPAN